MHPVRLLGYKIQLLMYTIFFSIYLGKIWDHPSITSTKRLGGWVSTVIYADKKGGWGPKRPKICWRNIGMVPILPSLITYIQSSLYLEILGHPEKTTLPKDDLVHNPHLLNSPSFSLLNLSNSLGIIISGQLLFQINNNGKLSKHLNSRKSSYGSYFEWIILSGMVKPLFLGYIPIWIFTSHIACTFWTFKLS